MSSLCSDVNGNGPLESTLRSYRALALQLMRRTITPENRPDAVRGVICMTYMVSAMGLCAGLCIEITQASDMCVSACC